MKKKWSVCTIMIILVSACPLWGGTGRPSDGFLFFIVLLGFLGLILGILYLLDYLKIVIRRFMERNGEEIIT